MHNLDWQKVFFISVHLAACVYYSCKMWRTRAGCYMVTLCPVPVETASTQSIARLPGAPTIAKTTAL